MNRLDEELGVAGGQGRTAEEIAGDAWFWVLLIVVIAICGFTLAGCRMTAGSMRDLKVIETKPDNGGAAMTNEERAVVLELVHQLDDSRQVIKLLREEKRIYGASKGTLGALDELMERGSSAIAQGRAIADQAWVDRPVSRPVAATMSVSA